MAAYFFDTSTLVKQYAAEANTAWVTGLIAPASIKKSAHLNPAKFT